MASESSAGCSSDITAQHPPRTRLSWLSASQPLLASITYSSTSISACPQTAFLGLSLGTLPLRPGQPPPSSSFTTSRLSPLGCSIRTSNSPHCQLDPPPLAEPSHPNDWYHHPPRHPSQVAILTPTLPAHSISTSKHSLTSVRETLPGSVPCPCALSLSLDVCYNLFTRVSSSSPALPITPPSRSWKGSFLSPNLVISLPCSAKSFRVCLLPGVQGHGTSFLQPCLLPQPMALHPGFTQAGQLMLLSLPSRPFSSCSFILECWRPPLPLPHLPAFSSGLAQALLPPGNLHCWVTQLWAQAAPVLLQWIENFIFLF